MTQAVTAPGASTPTAGNGTSNSAPSIFGTPASFVMSGASYAFTPAATDPDFDTLSYAIVNKPDWASFSTATGRLSGTPDDSALGTTSAIVISVSDGAASASLPPFDLTVAGSNSVSIAVSNTQPDTYEWSVLEDGEKAFIDRDFEFGDIPAAYEGLDFLRTANGDKFVAASNSVSFDVPIPVTVYVAYDSRIPILPQWISSWENTGDHWDGPNLQTDVYRRDFPAGRVELGGNQMGFSMYNVAIGPQVGATPAPTPPGAPPVQPPSPPSTQPPPSANSAPTISGTPATVVTANNSYEFVPIASDPDGDRVTFAISNKPGWASFNTGTGRLAGTPGDDDVGISGTIFIRATDGQRTVPLPAFSITVQPTSSSPPPPNSAPTISGTPATVVTADNSYAFVPIAFDPDGDRLTFSISNKPGWAGFNTGTGRLAGTPGTADVGVSGTITIRVSDGQRTVALPAFSITVEQSSTPPPPPPPPTSGSVTLNWDAPTQNADGSQLNDLAGFRVYSGTSLGNYALVRTISNTSVTAATINNLSATTWYFVVTAYDSSGNESVYSNAASKTIVTP
ncbi:MAG: putative Ig domain-containing protein [Gammaproteobacteria bacterium]